MDPVTIVLIAVVALSLGPKALSVALYGGIKLFKKIKKSIQQQRQYRRSRNKKIQARNKNTIEMKKAIERNRTVEFINTKTRAKKRVNIQEMNNFNINQDIILPGKVIVKGPNGEEKFDNIYLFAPRLYGMNNVLIGPKKDKLGHLYDDNAYLLKLPNENDIYKGYVPKREVISGLPFDLIDDSVNSELGNLTTLKEFVKDDKIDLKSLKNFIRVELKKDEKGNFIPLDKNNQKEMSAFNKYCEERLKLNNQPSYLYGLIQDAMASKEEYDYQHRPIYAKPIEVPDQREQQRIRKARESRAKREARSNAYYNRLADINMMDSAMHAYNLDEHASHIVGPSVPLPPKEGMGANPKGPGMGRKH